MASQTSSQSFRREHDAKSSQGMLLPLPSPIRAVTDPGYQYYEMIIAWGGWALFQSLLSTLSTIATKYNVSISNVAVRWVLDHEFVGAAIIGARMGVSEHTEENLRVFSFKLDEADKAGIETVLDRCRAREMFDAMGDCGAEYRQ
jgi:diketogulonate reductase-like aldo/keto reductase